MRVGVLFFNEAIGLTPLTPEKRQAFLNYLIRLTESGKAAKQDWRAGMARAVRRTIFITHLAAARLYVKWPSFCPLTHYLLSSRVFPKHLSCRNC